MNKDNYQNLSNREQITKFVYLHIFFLKFAHVDEIDIFQFLTNFTKIAMVSHIAKLHLYNLPLWKAAKIYNL